MRNATILILAKLAVVFLLNEAISAYILHSFRTAKEVTAVSVVNLLSEKVYSMMANNVLFSVLLFFALRKWTDNAVLPIVLICVSSYILNVVIWNGVTG